MAGSNKIQFFLFASMIFLSAEALEISLGDAEGDIDYSDGYEVLSCTKRVILYVVDAARYTDIMNSQLEKKREKIYVDLSESYSELLYLGVKDFKEQDENAIREFILNTIKHPNGLKMYIKILAEVGSSSNYITPSENFVKMFEEDKNICQGKLIKRVESLTIEKKKRPALLSLLSGKK